MDRPSDSGRLHVGVLAHGEKRLGTDVEGLRHALDERGRADAPFEVVPSASRAHDAVERLLEHGVDRVLVWGGDGTTRRCIHTLVERDVHDVSVGLLPAGTANLLARNLDVPIDLDGALDVALGQRTVAIDIGVIGDAHFAVAGGVGLDADLVRANDEGRIKERLGRLGHLWSALRVLPATLTGATVTVDGQTFHEGPVSTVMMSNVATSLGGLRSFPDADPADGRLHVGVVWARTRRQWARLALDIVRGNPPDPDLASRTTGTAVDVSLETERRWQVDGSDRDAGRVFSCRLLPRRIPVCVPSDGAARPRSEEPGPGT